MQTEDEKEKWKQNSVRSNRKVKLNFYRSISSSREISQVRNLTIWKKEFTCLTSFTDKIQFSWKSCALKIVVKLIISYSTPWQKITNRQEPERENLSRILFCSCFIWFFKFWSTFWACGRCFVFAKLARLTLQLVNIFYSVQLPRNFEFLFFD